MIPLPTKSATQLLFAALDVARSQIGVKESPIGSNSGKEVSAYLMAVGLNPGYSWCAAFLYWCFKVAAYQLGIPNPVIKTAGCIDHWNKAKKTPYKQITARQAIANPTLIRPGMIGILLINANTQAGHTFIVEKCSGLNLSTIEGNSNELGSAEGLGVYRLGRRKLTDKTLVGFIDYSTKTY